jgi:hypothetical protein
LAEYQILTVSLSPQGSRSLVLKTYLFRRGCSRLVHHIETTTSILGEILASNAPMMNLKIAIPVKEVKADMMHTLEPHPKNCQISEYRQRG